jgi:fatty acid desaturase
MKHVLRVGLRNKSDFRTLGFIAAYFAVLAGAWRLDSRVALVCSAALLAWLAWINAIITHNVVHVPLWHSRSLNRLTQMALSMTYGFPVSDYVPGHNLSHHRYIQSRRDVMRTTKTRLPWNAANLVAFFFAVSVDVIRANARYAKFAHDVRPRWLRERRAEIVVSWGMTAALGVLDWRRMLLLWLLPHLAAVWGVTTVNYLQHDGCDTDDAHNHSRNFVGRLFNWFHFNAGFHGMHHMQPTLHWSLLRQAHAERLAPCTHPALDQPSLVLYVLRTFALERRRLRYDGQPVSLPAEGPDGDWISDPALGGSATAAARGRESGSESAMVNVTAEPP